jgi:hypothetical protein
MLQRANLRRKVAIAVAAFAATAGAQAQLIVNGGFEDPAFVDNGSHYVRMNGAELTGWSLHSVHGGNVLFDSGFSPVGGGAQAVELEASDWISQSFATVAGSHYRLSFDLSAYTGYGGPAPGSTLCPCASWIDVGIDATWTTFAGSSAGYTPEALDFVADSSSTTLTFRNAVPMDQWRNYPHLDNVAVEQVFEETQLRITTAVPEPETYALLLAGLALLRLRKGRAGRGA